MRLLLSFISIIFLASICAAQTAKPESRYTSLRPKDCKEDKSELENGLMYKAICKGLGGYSIASFATEHTASIDVLTSEGAATGLEVRSHIPSAAPSGLGDKAEWRMTREGRKDLATALIVRFNIFSDPANTRAARSYLVVLKLSGLSSCVVGVLEPSKDQNVAARNKADDAQKLPCMTTAH